jgi:hypothetical protein
MNNVEPSACALVVEPLGSGVGEDVLVGVNVGLGVNVGVDVGVDVEVDVGVSVANGRKPPAPWQERITRVRSPMEEINLCVLY